jgi:raffinose/stachyose/melibiose transport system substrate-binding protein
MRGHFLKRVSFVVILVLLAAASVGASGKNEAGSKSAPVALTAVTNIVGVQFDVLKGIAAKFTENNPNVTLDFTSPGSDYENIMKVKMASKDMPDVFSTHGWAVARYGDFLLDLSNEPWASQVEEGIKALVTDKKGQLLVLPMDKNNWGIVYNADVMDKYGVKMPLKTLDAFVDACQTIKSKSGGTVSPMNIPGGDIWPVGQVFDQLATPAFTTAAVNDQKALLEGTFDWNKWTGLVSRINDMYKKGYFNQDLFTEKTSDCAKSFGEGSSAIIFYGNSLVQEARKYNPNVRAGLQPLPAIVPGDDMGFLSGEQTTFGIWKESKHIDAAKRFLQQFAKPDSIKTLCESEQILPGIKNVDADIGWTTPYYKQFKNTRNFPIFDRTFLPNGMWDLMCKDGAEMFSGNIKPEQFSADMKQNYDRLRASAQ